MLRELLSEEQVLPQLEASNTDEVVDRLLDGVCATGKVSDRALARRDIMANEQRMSTGMEHGIALPHAKTSAVNELVAAVATTRVPLAVPASGREPASLFILVLSSREQTGPHLRFLAEIGRLLRDRVLRGKLRAATTTREMLDLLTS